MPLSGSSIAYRDRVGHKFERLTVLEYEKRLPDDGPAEGWFFVRCDCGVERWVRAVQVVSRNTKSCGCLRRELSRERLRVRHAAAI